MSWKMDLPRPRTILYYAAKLTGLAPITLKHDGFYPATFSGKMYSVAVAAGTLSLTWAVLFFRWKFIPMVSTTQNVIDISYIVSTCSALVVTVISFLSKNKEIANLMTDLWLITRDFESFGIVEDNDRILKNIILTSLTVNALLATVSIILSVIGLLPTVFIIFNITRNLATFNSVLIFVQILIFIRGRFASLNEKLCHAIVTPADQAGSLRSSPISSVSEGLDEEDLQPRIDCQRIQNAAALHAKLCDLLDRTTRIFALPILLISILFFGSLLLHCHRIYNDYCRDSDQFSGGKNVVNMWCEIVACMLHILITTAQLFLIAHASDTTCHQGNDTKRALSKFRNKFHPAELKNEVSTFSMQLLNRPVAVSVFGFFSLNYSYICKISFTVVAYLIVVVQFDKTKEN